MTLWLRRASLASLVVFLPLSGAVAQTVYRCGADGRSYQAAPCSDGRPVDVSDARTDEQRRAATEASAREARLGAQLERERRAREAAVLTARSAAMGRAPAEQGASAPQAYGRPHSRGVRYFADGRPGAPIYRTPAAPAHKSK